MKDVDAAVSAIKDEITLAQGVTKVEAALDAVKATLPSDRDRFLALLDTFAVKVELNEGSIVTPSRIWNFDAAGKYWSRATAPTTGGDGDNGETDLRSGV